MNIFLTHELFWELERQKNGPINYLFKKISASKFKNLFKMKTFLMKANSRLV